MHEIVQKAVDALEKRITQIKLTEEDVILVERLMPNAHIWVDSEVNVDWIVEGKQDVKKVLRAFAQEGVMLKNFVDNPQSPTWYLKGKNVTIRLCPTWKTEGEGSKCQLVVVGQDTYTHPRYKLVCSDEENGEVAASGTEGSR